jgi:hypothetical protein
MGFKLKEVIENFEYNELIKIQKDIENGGIHIKRLIDTEIKKKHAEHEKFCAVCQKRIDPEDINNFTLVFGPDSFKKKASFCALDCMEYFMANIKKIREVQI